MVASPFPPPKKWSLKLSRFYMRFWVKSGKIPSKNPVHGECVCMCFNLTTIPEHQKYVETQLLCSGYVSIKYSFMIKFSTLRPPSEAKSKIQIWTSWEYTFHVQPISSSQPPHLSISASRQSPVAFTTSLCCKLLKIKKHPGSKTCLHYSCWRYNGPRTFPT